MIITTIEEFRKFAPSHLIDDLTPFYGAIESSEQDFLKDRIGKPLYDALVKRYAEITDKYELTPGEGVNLSVWYQFINLCQRVVAYDMLRRSAGMMSLSINGAGLNVVSADNYDAADKDSIERFSSAYYKEAHQAMDRLLIELEDWEQSLSEDSKGTDAYEIVQLWKKSKYYYRVAGLLISTAKEFNGFVNIYENREKFIQLLPDMLYCQDFIIRDELGDDLLNDLIKINQAGIKSEYHRRAIYYLKFTLALMTEHRSSLFSRKEAKDESIGAMKRAVDYMKVNYNEMPESIYRSPFGCDLPAPGEEKPEAVKCSVSPWQNNQKGNYIFVSPSI